MLLHQDSLTAVSSESNSDFLASLFDNIQETFGNIDGLDDLFGGENGKQVEVAFLLAELMHFDEKRKNGSGKKYIEHVKDVCLRVIKNSKKDVKLGEPHGKSILRKRIIISLLHDILEDTPISYEVIVSFFGKEIAGSVKKLTKDSWISYIRDIPGINLNPEKNGLIDGFKHQEGGIFIQINDNFDKKKHLLDKIFPLFQDNNTQVTFLYHTGDFDEVTFLDSYRNFSSIIQFKSLQEYRQANHDIYESLSEHKKKAKEMRNKRYYESFFAFSSDELCVKFSDRESNLSDLDGMPFNHIVTIISDTVTYYLRYNSSSIVEELKILLDQRVNCLKERVGSESLIELILAHRGISTNLLRIPFRRN